MRQATFALLLTLSAGLIVGCSPSGETMSKSESDPAKEPKAKVETNDAEASYKEAAALYNQRKYVESRPIFIKAADTAGDDGIDLKVKALSLAARTYGLAGDCEEGRPTLERARKLLKDASPIGKAAFGIVDGIFIREMGDKLEAEKHFAALAEYCKEHELWEKAVDAIHHAAIVAKPEDQIKWSKAGIEAAKAGGETTKGWLPSLWNNLGWSYDEAGMKQEALDALIEAQKAHHAKGSHGSAIAADSFVAHALIKVGKIDEAAEILDAVDAATEKALKETPKDEHWIERRHYVEWKRGDIAAARDQKDAALKLYRSAYKAFGKLNTQGWYTDWIDQIEASANKIGGTATE